MRYAEPTNASGNNARSRVISTAAAANMNNLVCSDALTSRAALESRARYPAYKCRGRVQGWRVNHVFFTSTSALTALIIYIDFASVNLKVEFTTVNPFLFFFAFQT